MLVSYRWRRQWQPTPLFLPRESQGRGTWWAAVYGVAQSWPLKRQAAAAVPIKGTPLYLVITCLYAPMVLKVTNVLFKVIETIQNIYQCHY